MEVYINPMIGTGVLEMTEPDNPTSRNNGKVEQGLQSEFIIGYCGLDASNRTRKHRPRRKWAVLFGRSLIQARVPLKVRQVAGRRICRIPLCPYRFRRLGQ